jgi:acetyl/propionyl-CoA carboxylase alpha subunit
MGVRTVAVYSDADAGALHTRLADEAYPIGPSDAAQSYLNMQKILEVAARTQAEAVHPGYGFLAENPEFVEMCEKQGLTFIGPSADCMHQVKPKHRARDLMRALNIPVVRGYDEILTDFTSSRLAHIEEVAETLGYPVILKPSGGGGGIGMTIARSRDGLKKAVSSVEQKGWRIFGVTSFYIEKFLTGIKHIEFQVLADGYGNIIHLGERDCSIQRRFQKLIEEAPCNLLPSHLRIRMAAAALAIAVAMRYVNALTVEFFYTPETGEFYFNEVNTRLQVEHCVTEVITGVDIVKEQIRLAAGESLAYTQDDVVLRGSVIECRIMAEDATRNFLPCPGTVTDLWLPHGPGLRIDEGVYEKYEIPFYYDPLLLKVITWGETRSEAISRMERALYEMRIGGVTTNISFHQAALKNEVFVTGQHTTQFVEQQYLSKRKT